MDEPTKKPVIDYSSLVQSSGVAQSWWVVSAVTLGVLTAMATVVFAAFALFIVPRIEQIFRDFKVELPLSTQLLLSLSRSLRDYPILLIGAVLPPLVAAGLFCLVTYRTRLSPTRPNSIRLVTLTITLLLVLLPAGVAIYSVFMPLVTLISSISGVKR